MPSTYKYDVFISYSSKDVAWATQLDKDLTDKGLTTYRDKDRLLGGDEWKKELLAALKQSRHLAVVWSNNADKSEWVRRERYAFETISNPVGEAAVQEKRRMIIVMLEGEIKDYGDIQSINEIKEANAYAGGFDNLDPNKWRDVIQKVSEAILNDDASTPIPLAVLAMTRGELLKIDPAIQPDFGPSLNDLIAQLNIGTINDLTQHYGAERLDWRPFGSNYNIRSILDLMEDEINNGRSENEKRLEPPFRWEPIDKNFWTSIEIAKRERGKLLSSTNLSLIVIDPLSLYYDLVYQRLSFLSKCFENDKSLIMVLSPQTMPTWIDAIRTLIENRGTPFFDYFFKPPIPIDKVYANCSVNISNQSDLKRLIRTGLGYARKPLSESPIEYLRMGKV